MFPCLPDGSLLDLHSPNSSYICVSPNSNMNPFIAKRHRGSVFFTEPGLIQRLNMVGNEELLEGSRLEGHSIKWRSAYWEARKPSNSDVDNDLML